MPRPAKMWKKAQNGDYYATINAKQERLGPDYKKAKEMFDELRAKAAKKKHKPTQLRLTIGEARDLFLSRCKIENAERTHENRSSHLQSFCDYIGENRKVRNISKTEFIEWARSKNWSESTQTAAKKAVTACLNWCVKLGHLAESPLWGLPRGKFKRRERILKPWEKEKIRAIVKGNLAEFLYFLEMTGCRPFSEASLVSKEMIDWEEGSVTLERHKNSSKGKRRVVYFPPQLLARLQELAKVYPEGPLLRTKQGRPWGRPAACRAMRRIERKAKLDRLTVYAWRHTYATEALSRGVPIHVLAELMGTSPRTLERYYCHLDARKDVLRKAAQLAVGPT